MSNLHSLQWVVIEMTSYSHHLIQTKYKNRQKMETNDTCFCEESSIDRSFLVLKILKGERVDEGRNFAPAHTWLQNPKSPW